MKKTTKNFHRNFKDLVPIQKKANIHQKAIAMEEKIIAHILHRVKEERKKNFKNELEEGKKLTFLQIRRLNTMLKREYVNHIVKEDDKVKEYIEEKENKILEHHDNVNAFIYDLED